MSRTRSLIKANILTGFLGAGKTSLLNRLLSQPDLDGTAVIINEFGAIGLDHLLVESVDDDIVLLKSGCICCTIRGDLKDAVLSLFEKRQAGIIAPFDRLVIETTGLADPAPIVATLSADIMLKYHFTMGNIVTVIDVPNGLRNLEHYEASARQVAVADRIVISKTDLASPGEIDTLVQAVARMNPAAEIVLSDDAQDPGSVLLSQDIHDLQSRSSQVRRWIAAERFHDHPHTVDDVNRHGTVRSTALTCDHPLNWQKFSLWLSMLVHRHGDRILRIKGVLNIENVATPVVMHGVQHIIHKPVHLDGWANRPPTTSIVLISEGELPNLQRSFAAFTGCGTQEGSSVKAAAGD